MDRDRAYLEYRRIEPYMLTDTTHLVADKARIMNLYEFNAQRNDNPLLTHVVITQLNRVCTGEKRWDEKGLEISETLAIILRDLGAEVMTMLYYYASDALGRPVSPVSVTLVKELLNCGYRDHRYQRVVDEKK